MSALKPNSQLQDGRYRIISTLGQGGFGITYLAVQSGLERKVAIKEFFMKEMCDRDSTTSHVTLGTVGGRDTVMRFRDKFLKEARNIAKFDHPNIVSIIDVFEENGTAYYVMKYAEGGTLADKVKVQGALHEAEATRYILQIANALAYIHKLRITHLDVKPANIMLNEKDDAVLIDFGLSKQYDTSTGGQTSTTPVGISEGYAPLEQYKTGGVSEFSPQTDVYALGATFYKLLTGKTPLTPQDRLDLQDENFEQPLRQKGVNPRLINIISTAMRLIKRQRYQDAGMFLDALKAYLQGSPITQPELNDDIEVTVVLPATNNGVQPNQRSSTSVPSKRPAPSKCSTQSNSAVPKPKKGSSKGKRILLASIILSVILTFVFVIVAVNGCDSTGDDEYIYADSVADDATEYPDTAVVEEESIEEYKTRNERFMSYLSGQPGFNTLEGGVIIYHNTEGSNVYPSKNSTVRINFKLRNIDDELFASENDCELPLTGVIDGLAIGISYMTVGSTATIYIPYDQGYGDQGQDPIKPYSTLICEVELLEIL